MSCAALLLATQLNSCAPAVKALQTCAGAEMVEMSRSASATYGTSAGTTAVDSRKAVSSFNRASDAQFRCETVRRRAETLCEGDPDFARAQDDERRDVIDLGNWMNRLLNQVRQQTNNDRTGPVLNCIPSYVDGINHWDCRLLTRTGSRARIVSSADLPLTVGVSRQCTFTVLPDGRLLTANHCGENDLDRGMIYRYYSWTPVTARFTGGLRVDEKALYTGQPFEDVSVWTPENTVSGRPFYILVRDPHRNEGCGIENNLYVVCSPNAFAELHLKTAHVIGFPYARYVNRDRAETVILADGKLLYDPASSRFLIHAAMGQGGSGGPAYVDAGQSLGGLTLDRPLYLGPVSGFSPPRPLPPASDGRWNGTRTSQLGLAAGKMDTDINFADSLVIVGIVNASDLRAILPPP